MFFDGVRAEAVEDADLQLAAQANTLENFSLVYKKKEEAIAIDRMDKNQELVEKSAYRVGSGRCIYALFR